MIYKKVKLIEKPKNASKYSTYPYINMGTFLNKFTFLQLVKLIISKNLGDFANEDGSEYECMGCGKDGITEYYGQYHTLYIDFNNPNNSYFTNTSDYYEA